MLKHQSTLVTGLATLLVAPPLLFGDELQTQLEDALAGTVQAIEVVSGLQEQLEKDPEGAIPLVLSVTERPEEGGQEQDEHLSALRQQVSLLRMQLDAMENPEAPAASAGTQSPATPSASGAPDSLVAAAPGNAATPPTGRVASPVIPTASTSTGLTPSVRALLKRNTKTRTVNPALQEQFASTETQAQPQIDANSYSADPLGQAKASYRAGRFADGLVLLENRKDAESLYWRARCLARLDRYDEAIETMMKVIELEGDSYTGKRAATDLEFFRWKRDFDKKLPQRNTEGGTTR